MHSFALLESELPSVICRPKVRQRILAVLRAVKTGNGFQVPGWSQDGVRVILNSHVFQFRTLYLVSAERCDCGELHTNDAIYCVAAETGEQESVVREIHQQVSLHVRRFFDDLPLDDFNEDVIEPPEGISAGVIVYDDPEEHSRHSLFFMNQALAPRAGVGLVCQAISEYFSDEEDDEEAGRIN